MAGARSIARRGFIVGSAALAGGVAFGVYSAVRSPANPLAADLAQGAVSFNPWIKIDAETITLVTPHVDLGQGAAHMQALLMAEELDVDPGQFETTFGPPADAYFNTVLAADGLPFLPAETGRLASMARGATSIGSKIIGLQTTGGSTSVPDSFDKLRMAGAVARETLKHAASRRYDVALEELKTHGGAVVLPDGRRIPYQALASAAADLDPVRDVVLRPDTAWRLIGQPTMRADIAAKSLGTQAYGIDVALENMRFATVRLSPTRSAVTSADLTAAHNVPEVVAVLPVTNGFGVVARSTWSAFQGALAIEATWADAAYHAEQAAHWAELENSFTDDRLDANWRNEGDVEGAVTDGDIAAEYRAPYVAHQPLEPLNATVLVREESVEVWTATQMPRFAQAAVAQVTGHRTEDVILHNQFAGGSFGHRLELDHIVHAAEIAVQMKGTPVKLTYSREEDFAQDYPRHIALARARGAVASGRVTSLSLDIAAAAPIVSQAERLGYPFVLPDMQIVAGAWNAPYAIENFRVRGYRAPRLAPVSSWRSVGASVTGFVLEGFLDEVIAEAGADPLQERLRLCNWDVARGVLEAAAEMSNWGTPLAAGKGRGVALVESFGVPTAEVVEVTATSDGIRIDKVWVAADVGRVVDPVNFENQVQGGVIWGLGHAINSEITYASGAAEQANYHDAEGLRLYQTPDIVVRGLERNPNIRGIGEPPVPPAAPALANAIFAATGQRLREMPFNRHIRFV